MSWRQWLVLMGIFVSYLLFGGGVFMTVEGPLEEINIRQLRDVQQRIYDELIACGANQSTEDAERREMHWIEIATIIDQPLLIKNGTAVKKWTLYNSFFVAMTVASTIGYGHMAPASPVGRFFCMIFALFGIPLNGILFANLADYFGSKFIRKSKKRPVEKWTACLSVIVEVALYLVPGFIVFLAIPAAIFSIIEDWNYGDSIYFAFITLTTIGFGDFIAGLTNVGDWTWLYRAFIIVWILFGLGYLVMVINIITRGLRSRPVLTLEKKMASRIRATRRRLAKDARLLHNLVNEIRVLNIKPVYKKEQIDVGTNAKSSHWLASSYIDIAEISPECQRWSSESALDAIDRDATFQQSEQQQNQTTVIQNTAEWLDDDPLELLSRLATVLCEDTSELGISSDDDITDVSSEELQNNNVSNGCLPVENHEYPAIDVERGLQLKRNLSRKCSFSPSFSMLRQRTSKLQRKLSIQANRQHYRTRQQRSVSESCSLPYKKHCDSEDFLEHADAADVTEEPMVSDVEQPLQSRRIFYRRHTEMNVMPELRLSTVEFCKTLQQVQTNRQQFNNESSI